MKVRSWKALILYLALGGAVIAYGVKNLLAENSNGIVYILVALIMLIRAVPDAISGDKHEENGFRAYAAQWYCRRQFGRFAPVMPWLGLLLLVSDGILVMLLPVVSAVRVLAGLLLGAALLCVILYGIWQKRQMDGMEDEEEIQADYAVYMQCRCQIEAEDRRRWGLFAPAVPFLGAVPIAVGLLLEINAQSAGLTRIALLLICAGLIGLFVGDFWENDRIARRIAAEQDKVRQDKSEQHL